MPKVALDRFYIITVFERDNSILMTQIVETQFRATHLLDDSLKAIINSSIGKKAAIFVGKNKIGFFPFFSSKHH